MDSTVPELGIRALKKAIEASRLESDALALQFQTAQTKVEKARIARAYDKVLKGTRALEFLLELRERKEQRPGDKDGE